MLYSQVSVISEVLLILKCLVNGLIFYTMISRTKNKFKYKSLISKDFILFYIPFVTIAIIFSLFIPEYFMLPITFIIYFIYYHIKQRRENSFFINSMVVITFSFLLIVFERISLMLATALGIFIINFIDKSTAEILCGIFQLTVFTFLIIFINHKNLFNTTIIKRMMKHKVMAISQVTIWALTLTLSVVNKYLIGQAYETRLYIGFAFLCTIYAVIAVAHYLREKRIDAFRMVLKSADREFIMNTCLALNDKHIYEDINLKDYAPKEASDPSNNLTIKQLEFRASKNYFTKEYENLVSKIDSYLCAHGFKYGTYNYFYLSLAVYAAYHSIRAENFYDDENDKESLTIDYIYRKIAYFCNLIYKEDEKEENIKAILKTSIKKALIKNASKIEKKEIINKMKNDEKAEEIMHDFMFSLAQTYLDNRYQPASVAPYLTPSLVKL